MSLSHFQAFTPATHCLSRRRVCKHFENKIIKRMSLENRNFFIGDAFLLLRFLCVTKENEGELSLQGFYRLKNTFILYVGASAASNFI